MRIYSIGKVASKIGMNRATLRNWDKEGIFKPFLVSVGGHRYYSQKQLDYLLELKTKNKLNRKIFCSMTDK
ncbi:MerR family transcriptional regulator (plasmid) [Clostridium baratii]